MKELIEFLIKELSNYPDEIEIKEEINESDGSSKHILYTITANTEDVPVLIGKGGRTIKSVRNICKVKAIKEGVYVDIKVESPETD